MFLLLGDYDRLTSEAEAHTQKLKFHVYFIFLSIENILTFILP
jgi:hypothetical protein